MTKQRPELLREKVRGRARGSPFATFAQDRTARFRQIVVFSPGRRAAVAAWWRRVYYLARNRSPHTLGASRRQLRLLSDAVPEYAIFRLDPHGTVISWDPAAQGMKLYRAGEVIGQNYSRFFVQADLDQGMPDAQLRLAARTGRAEFSHCRVRKDGSRFWAVVVLTAVHSRSGALLGFHQISRHISAAEQEVRTQLTRMESRYRALLEAAPDAMVVVNQHGVVVLLNAQAEVCFGYARDELVGHEIASIIPEGFEACLCAEPPATDGAAARPAPIALALCGRRKDATTFPIEVTACNSDSSDGTLVTAAIRDISERKRAEAHLLKTVEALKRSNDELSQFAHVASHDLQEPLRMIASYTQLLAKRYQGRLDADADEFIGYAVDGANRMQGLIQDLLTYARATVTEAPLRLVPSEAALQEALANLKTAITESGAVITSDQLPLVMTDQSVLTRVFQNLIGNAIKYRGTEPPRIWVTAVQREGSWTFAVQDNGLGIEPQYFERIFVIFQRLHARSEFQGTGIGLAICKKMVTRLGGRIWVESQFGQGSTFLFTLPAGEIN